MKKDEMLQRIESGNPSEKEIAEYLAVSNDEVRTAIYKKLYDNMMATFREKTKDSPYDLREYLIGSLHIPETTATEKLWLAEWKRQNAKHRTRVRNHGKAK